ncbi:MAG: glycosyltransferase family 2 protein [Patescibacteria group bacterium]
MDLSIVIVSWNAKKYLFKCLKSIFVFTNLKNFKFEVLVVDNASNDGSLNMIEKDFPQVKVINNKKNLGFAKANNQALKKVQGKYILFLNDDTEIFGNIFFILLNEFKMLNRHDNKIGILACKLLNSDGSLQLSVRRDPNLINQLIIISKLHHLWPSLLKNYEQHSFNYSKEQMVEQVMGAFMLTTRSVLEHVGNFDENFFIWFEEVDLQIRMRQAGYKIYYTPLVSCHHVKAVSFSQILTFEKQMMFMRSMRYFFKKQHNLFSYLIISSAQAISLIFARVLKNYKHK